MKTGSASCDASVKPLHSSLAEILWLVSDQRLTFPVILQHLFVLSGIDSLEDGRKLLNFQGFLVVCQQTFPG